MLWFILLTVILIISDYFLLCKYLKIENDNRFRIMFCIKALINILGCVIIVLNYRETVYGYFMLCFISLLTAIGCEDIISMKIDRNLSVILLVLGIIISFFVPDGTFWKIIVFATVIGLVLYLFSAKTNESVGKGDVICIVASALCFTFERVFSLMIYTLFGCLIYGTVQVLLKKISTKQGIPFVPFLVLGTFLTLYFV